MASIGRVGSSPTPGTKQFIMYTIYYYNNENEKVIYVCYTMEEAIEFTKQHQVSLVLDEANNIVTGEVIRQLNPTT